MEHFHIEKVAAPLPSVFLEDANWADAYEFSDPKENLNAPETAGVMFAPKPPLWIHVLNATRNRIVGLFGIKPGQITIDGTKSGAFPIISQSEETVVYGFDDWHLNFRIVIQTRASVAGRAVTLATLVHRKNWFGYCYIFLISPFHRMIVKHLLHNLSSR